MADDISLSVVRGQPDEAELAAVTAVLLALLRRAGEPDQERLAAYARWAVKGGGHRSPVAWSAEHHTRGQR